MTQVDFYVTQDASHDARERLACRLIEKAWKQGHRIHVHVDDESQARAIDELLWTFRDDNFIPHGLLGEETDATVLIGHHQAPEELPYLLVNLANEVPEFFSHCERVAEFIDQRESVRNAGRERFRFYRERGYTLETHNL